MENILLVTTPPSFGELIQQSLEETDRYQVVFVTTGAEAIEFAGQTLFGLAIVDAEVEDIPITELIGVLKIACPGIKFILIPLENRAGDPSFSNLLIHDYLMKPFYLPDLLEMVDRALPARIKETLPTKSAENIADDLSLYENSTSISTWFDDPKKTAQFLTSLALESAAQGILVLRGTELWACAGQMGQPAAEEVARMVSNYATSSKNGLQGKKPDLARFIRLGSTGGEYMLFATPLCGNMVLILLFEAETPFSQIRTQVYQMVRLLNSPADVIREKQGSHTIVFPLAATTSLPQSRSVGSQKIGVDETTERVFSKPLLDDVPAPMPKRDRKNEIGMKEIEQAPEVRKIIDPVQVAAKQDSIPKSVDAFVYEERQQTSLPVVFDLNYFCMLIPRMPYHKLNGDLAVRLTEWVGQLCMAYGWRLEHLSIHPDYMQWAVNVVPTVVPDYLMDTLRKQTSERVFTTFPQLGRDNPSGDFWAPGYLILTRLEQLSEQMIQDFIHRVRQYQGASSANS
jgi:CheY-like chemotaxis protein/REP element-mobilizing transposase RayT